jgi:hypothetical protein
VPDEFPTLEAVVIIGVIAALVGTFQLRAALDEIPKRAKDLQRALRAGDLDTARTLCGRAEGAGFAAIGGAVVGALGRNPLPQASELRERVEAALRRAQRLAQRGRARDLVVAAVLIGAGAYATGAALGVGVFFYAALGVALVTTALSPVLRRAVLRELERSSTGVLEAALVYLGGDRSERDLRACAVCGAVDSLRLGPLALGGVERFGIDRLDICLACGRVSGQVASPRAIVAEPTRGVELLSARPPPENSSTAPDREHDG